MMKLDWQKIFNGNDEGVYIIWYGTPRHGRVVYVGQGNITERLSEHRSNPEITRHDNQHNRLFVFWAFVEEDYRDGVERYLADRFAPLVGKMHPTDDAIRVNTPWD